VPLADQSSGHKTRVLPFPGLEYDYSVLAYSPIWNTSSRERYSGTYVAADLQGSQVTDSESHPGWRRASASGPDVGGEFFTQKRYAHGYIPVQNMAGDRFIPSVTLGMYWSYSGPVLPLSFSNTGLGWPPAFPGSDSFLNSLGATAIAITKPTNSLATLATSLLELAHEGLPKLLGAKTWESRAKRASAAGSDYLNYEFGYKPLVGEVLSVASAIASADDILKQYHRDAGRVVRRRHVFPPEVQYEFEHFPMTNAGPFLPASSSLLYIEGALPQGMGVIRTRKRTISRWFSGAYTYVIPEGDSLFGRMVAYSLEAKKLVGLSITPEVLWAYMPWTWAVDWFTNMGDVVSNISDMATDGLVVKYGYLMEHSICEDTYTWVGPTGLVDPSIVPSVVNLVTETKLRRRANPFGFGLTWEGLTNRQQAIMAALGLSKSSH